MNQILLEVIPLPFPGVSCNECDTVSNETRGPINTLWPIVTGSEGQPNRQSELMNVPWPINIFFAPPIGLITKGFQTRHFPDMCIPASLRIIKRYSSNK